MNNTSCQGSREFIVPFLIERSTPRSDGPHLPGYFCTNTSVWVIEGPNGPEPLVQSCEADLDLITTTKVQRERDDVENLIVLSAITKTAVQLESDDDKVRGGNSRAQLLELATKTEARRERDD